LPGYRYVVKTKDKAIRFSVSQHAFAGKRADMSELASLYETRIVNLALVQFDYIMPANNCKCMNY